MEDLRKSLMEAGWDDETRVKDAILDLKSESGSEREDECRCREIDFHRIFDEGGDETFLCSLQHAMLCLACPFCEYISDLVAESDYIAPYDGCDIECRIKRSIATPDEFPQRMAMAPYARLLLIVRGDLRSRRNHEVGVIGTSFTLDRVGVSDAALSDAASCSFYRRPIDRMFNPRLLSDWLDRSNMIEMYSKVTKFATLEPVLAKGNFRVVDVIQQKVIPVAQPVRYVALSYVWGQSMTNYAAITIHTSSDKCQVELEDCVDWDWLPRTVRDAIKLTRDIGEKYLWVDSLCINQVNAEEKSFLISQMGSIFANAYLTIVAADGQGADAGLKRLSPSQADDIWKQPLKFEAAGKSIALLRRKTGNRQAIIRSHWSSRGWTLQERLLSRRCVFFTNEQVYFQDAEVQVSEAYDIHQPKGSKALKRNAQNNETFDMVGDLYFRILEKKGLGLGPYDHAIREYSKRTLSHPGDRFDAFMGISENFQPADLPLDLTLVLNALPLKYFTNALRWRHVRRGDSPKRIRIDARNSRYLPSWSWVGWDGEVSGHLLFQPFAIAATIIDSANVLCEITRAPPGFALDPSEPSEPISSTLHLYTTSIPCWITEIDKRSEYRVNYGPNLQLDTYGTVEFGEKPKDHWKFELAVIGEREFWLLRVDQPYAERLTLVRAVRDEFVVFEHLREKYLRIR